jgi:hypothetical protein
VSGTPHCTLHISKKLIISRALARFFGGIPIDSNDGDNAKWISTIENIITDNISRLNALNIANSKSPLSSPT